MSNKQETNDLIDLDLKYYRSENKDLASFTDEQLVQHYFKNGYFEGRANNQSARREFFAPELGKRSSLEIGPFANPVLRHKKVDYFDVLSTEELRARAEQIGITGADIPNIKYVSPQGDLSIVDKKYDVVFSSHNVEHQPDLITHLNLVSDLLNDGGKYALIVPDCRYCFDADLPPSKISDVFDAFYERRSRHSIGSVIEHRALVTHNDAVEHWNNSEPANYKRLDTAKIEAAIKEYEAAGLNYIDVHSWQFNPLSFSDIISALITLNLINFSSVICNGPVYGRNEFTATITK